MKQIFIKKINDSYYADAVANPDNLIQILDTWQMMLQLRPNKIAITEENGIYKMFGVQ